MTAGHPQPKVAEPAGRVVGAATLLLPLFYRHVCNVWCVYQALQGCVHETRCFLDIFQPHSWLGEAPAPFSQLGKHAGFWVLQGLRLQR